MIVQYNNYNNGFIWMQLEPSKTVIDPNFENQIVGGLGKLESMGQASALLPEKDVYKTSSSSGSSVQPPPSHRIIDFNSPMETSVQLPPSQTIMDQESPGGNLVPPPPSQPIVDRERPPNPINWAAEWQNTILTLCSTTATGIAIQSMEKEFQFPPSFHWLSLANSLTFSALFVAKFVGRKSPAAVKVLEQFAVFLAVTIFFLAVAIPLPLHFKYSAWAIYAVTMIIVFICEIL